MRQAAAGEEVSLQRRVGKNMERGNGFCIKHCFIINRNRKMTRNKSVVVMNLFTVGLTLGL